MARIGCQTYTWEMLGVSWQGSPDDILDAVSGAGYDGIEFSNAMIGDYEHAPDRLTAALAERGLKLAAFAYATTGFTDESRHEADLAGAERALAFCRAMGVPLSLGGAAAASREDYGRHMAQAIRFYRAVAARRDARRDRVCASPLAPRLAPGVSDRVRCPAGCHRRCRVDVQSGCRSCRARRAGSDGLPSQASIPHRPCAHQGRGRGRQLATVGQGRHPLVGSTGFSA